MRLSSSIARHRVDDDATAKTIPTMDHNDYQVVLDRRNHLKNNDEDARSLDRTEDTCSTDDDDDNNDVDNQQQQQHQYLRTSTITTSSLTRLVRCETHPPPVTVKPLGIGGILLLGKQDHPKHRRTASCPLIVAPALDMHPKTQREDPNSTTSSKRSLREEKKTQNPTDFITATTSTQPNNIISLPTLPRYTPCLIESNCWSESHLERFRVRGPNYLQDKHKVPSQPYLLQARGCDLVLFDDDQHHQQPSFHDKSSSLLQGTLRQRPTLVINFRFPWGLLVLYFEIPQMLVPFMDPTTTTSTTTSMQGFTPAQRVLAQWLQGDADYKNRRIKLLPHVVNGPWVVQSLVTGKPTLIGTKVPVTYQHHHPMDATNSNQQQQPYLLMELDIGSGSQTAKRIVGVCRKYMKALAVDIGFVIQGDTPEELPEQMMGAICVHGVDPLRAPILE